MTRVRPRNSSACPAKSRLFKLRREFALCSLILLLLPVYLSPRLAAASAYSPGVRPGDYVKYGSISVFNNSTDPNEQTVPQNVKDIENTEFFRLDVQNVSGVSLFLRATVAFKNDTTRTTTLVEKVTTSVSTILDAFEGVPLFVTAGGLGQGDKLWDYAGSPTINQTLQRTYAGASRDVNLFTQSSFSSPLQLTSTSSEYYDRSSGMTLDFFASSSYRTGNSNQYMVSGSSRVIATETNIWAPWTLGISPMILYGILGVASIATAIAVIGVWKISQRKVRPNLS